jgi:hypothetical protein
MSVQQALSPRWWLFSITEKARAKERVDSCRPGLADGCCKEGSFEGYVFCRKKKQNDSERGVGSGWRRGGIVEDINVCEDRKGYCLVALVSGYVLVHFFLSKEGEGMEKKRVQCGVPPVPDVKFVPEIEYKLFNPSVPEGYVIFPIPTSIAASPNTEKSVSAGMSALATRYFASGS